VAYVYITPQSHPRVHS